MIKVEGLQKAYGGVRACDNMTLDFEPGEITAVIGPNGAGKSTLVQLLSGVVKADNGRILLDDVNITRMSSTQRYSLGLVRTFQTARLFPGLDVFECVLMGAYNGLLHVVRKVSSGKTIRDVACSLFQPPSWLSRSREAETRALEGIDKFG